MSYLRRRAPSALFALTTGAHAETLSELFSVPLSQGKKMRSAVSSFLLIPRLEKLLFVTSSLKHTGDVKDYLRHIHSLIAFIFKGLETKHVKV